MSHLSTITTLIVIFNSITGLSQPNCLKKNEKHNNHTKQLPGCEQKTCIYALMNDY